jgi:hypothetical protein
MRRRDFIAGLAGATAWPISARAQLAKVYNACLELTLAAPGGDRHAGCRVCHAQMRE